MKIATENCRKNWQAGGFGIYLHWPFCAALCPYCDFNSHLFQTLDYTAWQEAFITDLRAQHHRTQGRVLNSVFFGGGTPSLMPPALVGAILDEINTLWGITDEAEITLEANPTSVEAGNFAKIAKAGVNRLSLGVQALNDMDLGRLGRLHTADEAVVALATAQQNFPRVSFDLIYARPFQTHNSWQAELTRAMGFGVEHLSLYQLTIEPNTVFYHLYQAGKLKGLPDDDLSADLFEMTQRLCIKQGLPAYEVSNHARAGCESKHNMIYWRGGDWLGIGPGAHGRICLDKTRIATTAKPLPKDWLEQVKTAGTGSVDGEIISQTDQAREYVMMSLRLNEGCDYRRLESIGGAGVFNAEVKTQMIKDGLLSQTNSHLIAQPKGRIILNTLLAELLV